MTSKCTFLPNLSQLSLYRLDQLSVNAKKPKHAERVNYEFPAAGIQITEVDWKAVRETLSMDARYQPADTQGYPAYKLTFYKSGTETPLAINLVMTMTGIKMMSTNREGYYCFRVGFPVIFRNSMYVSDLFYDAHREELKCDMAPQYGESSESVDLLLNSMTVIASKLGTVLKLQDASRFRRGTDTPGPSSSPAMTKTLRLKRGYSYYDARGFFPYLIDLAISKELQLDQNDVPRSYEYFLQAFQMNLDWIHLWMTTPLNALESKVPEFISSVAYESAPLVMKQLFVAAGDRFEYLSSKSLSYLIKDLDTKDTGLKERSVRQLVYEMDVPNPLYQERSNEDASFSTFMTDVDTFMNLIDVGVNIDGKEAKLQDRELTQRTFQILANDGKCSIQRMRVSVPGGSGGRPCAELVEVGTDISVIGMKGNV